MNDYELAQYQLLKDFPEIKNGRYLDLYPVSTVGSKIYIEGVRTLTFTTPFPVPEIMVFYSIFDNQNGIISAEFFGIARYDELAPHIGKNRITKLPARNLIKRKSSFYELTPRMLGQRRSVDSRFFEYQHEMDGSKISYQWTPSRQSVKIYVDGVFVEFIYTYDKGKAWRWYANKGSATMKKAIALAIEDYRTFLEKGEAVDIKKVGGAFLVDLDNDSADNKKRAKSNRGRPKKTVKDRRRNTVIEVY